MARYAVKTTVSSEKSRCEIERTLERYGATSFVYGNERGRARIAFEMYDRRILFVLMLPKQDAKEFVEVRRYGRTVKRHADAAYKLWEQACRQRWRALALVVKAKLESVVAGIATFEEEFLAHIVLPDGKTVGEFMLPQVAIAYEQHRMPPMLPYLGDRK